MEAVRVKNLKKRYGKLEVLKGINFVTNFGKITAILGPNASGKTTLVKCILGHVVPSDGEIYVKGLSTFKDVEYKKFIGYAPQEPDFPENLTPAEILNLISSVRETPPSRAKELMKTFGLENFMKRKIKNLSGGTKQKVNLLLALSFDAEILILDEPTVGLDPISNVRFKEVIIEEKERGKAILMSSHIISEVEELADEILFLMDGKVRIRGSVEEVKRIAGERKLERAIVKLLEGSSEINKAVSI